MQMTILETFSGLLSLLKHVFQSGYYSFADLWTLPVENTSNFEGPGKKNTLRFMDSESQVRLNPIRQ